MRLGLFVCVCVCLDRENVYLAVLGVSIHSRKDAAELTNDRLDTRTREAGTITMLKMEIKNQPPTVHAYRAFYGAGYN